MSHQPYAIEIGGSILSAISRQSVSSTNQISSDVHAGSPYPQCVTINGQKNQADFSTEDIETAIDLVGTAGLAIGASPVKVWQLELDDETGLPKSGSDHRLLTIPRGKVIPQRLSCEHQGNATLDLMAHALWDPSSPTDPPITSAETQALPTGLAGDSRWTIAAVKVAGQDLPCALRFDLDFGIRIESEGCNSDIHDRTLIVTEIKPVVTISGKNVKSFLSTVIPLKGAAATHANTEIYLRRRLTTEAGFDPVATTSHIKITADGLATWERVHDTQNNRRIENGLRIDCRHDGTNVPVVITTGVALT
ncbi:hypothetical protein [Crateriforma conspicua]|uniref:Uncharacterized protein n=1 Tax=Crateriforma conspicua TaxID=2527996 RepID=A0A5C6FYS5_9PLAN|nr:hypothetical protein [Crateriforma conspicua]TWU66450.1 hypothetical protein V7x_20160 [Crateriforma conspicua]